MRSRNMKEFHPRRYKIVLGCIWAVILVVCFLNRDFFTLDGVLGSSPSNIILTAAFMMLLFALKSLSIFVFSGFLFIADGILFPLPAAILLNIMGACIMISLPYWVGKQMGKDVIDHIVEKYPKAGVFKQMRSGHEFILSFMSRAVSVLPSDILSLYMGAAGIHYKKYVTGSILGMLVPIVTFPIMGTSITDPRSPAFLISTGIQLSAGIISAAGCWLYSRSKKR